MDYELVRAHLNDWADRYDVRLLAFDPWNATDLVTRLEKQDGFTCVKMRQGKATLSAPSKALEQAVLSNGPCAMTATRSCAGTSATPASIPTTPATSSPARRRSTERIDGIYALVMALDAMHRDTGTRPPEYQMIIVSPTL